MEIKRKDLLDALDKLKPGLSPKELVEQMTQFNFLGKHLVTYNEIVSVFVPFETDFICSVKADVFQGILSKIGETDVKLDIKDNEVKDDAGEVVAIQHKLLLETATVEAEFPILIEGDISEAMRKLQAEIVDAEWLKTPEDFVDGAYLCMFSASKDPADNTMTCINVEGEDLVSCDNTRATCYTMKSPMEPFLIQAEVAKELKKYKPTHYRIGENWIHFRNEKDGVIFNVRRVKGKVKDMRPFLKNKEGIDFNVPPELGEAIELAGVVNADDNPVHRLVELSIEKQKAICSAWKEGGAKVKKEVTIPFYTGEEISFFINPDFMMEIIERSEPDKESGQKTPKMIINLKKKMAYFVNKSFDHALLLRA